MKLILQYLVCQCIVCVGQRIFKFENVVEVNKDEAKMLRMKLNFTVNELQIIEVAANYYLKAIKSKPIYTPKLFTSNQSTKLNSKF